MPRTLQVESINSSSTGLDLQTSNTSKLFIRNSDGFVGIGIANPTSKFHVYGSGADIRLTDTGVTNAEWRILAQTGNTTKLFRIYDATQNLDRLTIDSSGRVGVGGLTSMKGALHVSNTLIGSDTGRQVVFPLNLTIGNGGSDYACISYNGDLRTASNNTTGVRYLENDSVSQLSFSGNGGFIFRGAAPGTAGNTVTLTEICRMTRGAGTTGSVSIGTTDESTKLNIGSAGFAISTTTPGASAYGGIHFSGITTADNANGISWNGNTYGTQAGIYVRGSGAYGTQMFLATTDNYTTGAQTRMTISHSGKVGIGTVAPEDQLHVGGTGRINLMLGSSVATDSIAGIYWHTTGSTNYAIHRTSGPWIPNVYQQLRISFDTGIILDTRNEYDRSFVQVDGTGLRVSTGNIGIGTTTKTLNYKLDIYGSAWNNCQRIYSSGTSSGIDFWDSAHLPVARKGAVYSDGSGFGLLNHAGSWGLRINYGTPNVVIPNGSLTVARDILINANYGYGLVGLYDSVRFQSVFAMGPAYTMTADGTSLSAGTGNGNFYGIAWSHPNVGGQGANLSTHGQLIVVNGITQTALSSNIWCIGNITAYSDERVKTNWRNFDNNFVEKLAKVKSGIYDRTDINEKDNGIKTQVGVSAQSLRQVMPNAVTSNKDGELSVSYGNAALASCVELAKEISKLKEEIAKIKENK
jgi:hypothetical protein